MAKIQLPNYQTRDIFKFIKYLRMVVTLQKDDYHLITIITTDTTKTPGFTTSRLWTFYSLLFPSYMGPFSRNVRRAERPRRGRRKPRCWRQDRAGAFAVRGRLLPRPSMHRPFLGRLARSVGQ
jgi:hypothetical protein